MEPGPSAATAPAAFTYRRARSGPLLAGLSLVIVAETAALHVWLVSRHPYVAWTLLALSLSTLGWLVADYRAMGRGAIRLGPETLDLPDDSEGPR